MNQEQIKKVFEDEAFVKQLTAAATPEDVQKLLETKGVSLTVDQIHELGDTIIKLDSGELTPEEIEKEQTGELNDDDLENVAGGSFIGAALGVGFVGLMIYTSVKSVCSGMEDIVERRGW